MAELTAFGYFTGNSLLHRLDARFKILMLITLSLTSLRLDFCGLTVLTLAVGAVVLPCRLHWKPASREARFFLVLLALVFVARWLSSGGLAVIPLKVSMQGLTSGALVCWRLAFVVFVGLCFAATTRPADIKAAVQWFLKALPLVPEKKVAAMMGLILRFIPLVFSQARQITEAQKARGIENRKNPLYRLIHLSLPVLRRSFECADHMAVAMEARCFSESRTDPRLTARRRDWLAAGLVAFLCTGLLILR